MKNVKYREYIKLSKLRTSCFQLLFIVLIWIYSNAAIRACFKSSIRSSTSSKPIAIRTNESVMPKSAVAFLLFSLQWSRSLKIYFDKFTVKIIYNKYHNLWHTFLVTHAKWLCCLRFLLFVENRPSVHRTVEKQFIVCIVNSY